MNRMRRVGDFQLNPLRNNEAQGWHSRLQQTTWSNPLNRLLLVA
jgi:hypothetical protein